MQQKGFATTAEAAAKKLERRLLAQRVTRRELIEGLGHLQRLLEFVITEVPGLKDKLLAKIAEEKAAEKAPADAEQLAHSNS